MNTCQTVAFDQYADQQRDNRVQPLQPVLQRIARDNKNLTFGITYTYQLRVIGALLTNFHLPQSTLLMLVSAFAGRELMLEAYRQAVEEKYRFYSYGDCMLIL